jgi:dihydrofolate reductase
MRKLIVNEFMSLDGVTQAPGAADEDTSGGFKHGGWNLRYMADQVAQKWALGGIVEAGGFLLGRRTYEIFAAYWPNAPEEEQVIAEPLTTKPKYVASRTLGEPLGWQNATLLRGDVADAVAALKQAEPLALRHGRRSTTPASAWLCRLPNAGRRASSMRLSPPELPVNCR